MKSRKFFISADIEGITDVTSWSETEKGQDGYEEARRQMSLEVSAACQAILDAKCEVVVRDGHGTARNIDHRLLPRGVKLMRGWAGDAGSMLAGLDSTYDGVLYIGYHAPAGSKGSPLAHTVDKDAIRQVTIDGILASEFTMNKLYAQALGVPSIFISGDETICRMAEEEVPGIYNLAVKTCKGNSTFNLHPEDACEGIYENVKQAVSLEWQKLAPQSQYEIEIVLGMPEKQKKVLTYPGVQRVSEDTIRYVARTATEINLLIDQVLEVDD